METNTVDYKAQFLEVKTEMNEVQAELEALGKFGEHRIEDVSLLFLGSTHRRGSHSPPPPTFPPCLVEFARIFVCMYLTWPS